MRISVVMNSHVIIISVVMNSHVIIISVVMNQRRFDNRAPLRHYFYIPRPRSYINLYIEYDFNYMKGARMLYLLWS